MGGQTVKLYRVTLPLPPNMANSRRHWRVKQRERVEYEDWAFVWMHEARAQGPRKPLKRATIRATLYVYAKMDMDNLVARLKWPVDYLVKAGWLVDDGPDVLDWTLPSQQTDRKRPRVEITLEG